MNERSTSLSAIQVTVLSSLSPHLRLLFRPLPGPRLVPWPRPLAPHSHTGPSRATPAQGEGRRSTQGPRVYHECDA